MKTANMQADSEKYSLPDKNQAIISRQMWAKNGEMDRKWWGGKEGSKDAKDERWKRLKEGGLKEGQQE